MTNLFMLLAAAAGAAFALQGPINGGLSKYVGGAMPAAVISFFVGSVSVVIAYVLTSGSTPTAPLKAVGSAPPQLLVAGLFGAFGITAMAFVVPRVGSATAVTAMIFGQLIATLLTERFGWFTGQASPIELKRWIGAAVMALGVWLLKR